MGPLCRLLSPDSLNPHPLTALRFENPLLSLISERPLQQLSSSVSRGMPVILTCLGVFSEGVHILQGSSLLVGDPCQLLGPLYFSSRAWAQSGTQSLRERPPKFALSWRDSASQPVMLPTPSSPQCPVLTLFPSSSFFSPFTCDCLSESRLKIRSHKSRRFSH